MKKQLLTICLIAASLVLIVLGIFEGQTAEVFRKAVTVCLECVGIG